MPRLQAARNVTSPTQKAAQPRAYRAVWVGRTAIARRRVRHRAPALGWRGEEELVKAAENDRKTKLRLFR